MKKILEFLYYEVVDVIYTMSIVLLIGATLTPHIVVALGHFEYIVELCSKLATALAVAAVVNRILELVLGWVINILDTREELEHLRKELRDQSK